MPILAGMTGIPAYVRSASHSASAFGRGLVWQPAGIPRGDKTYLHLTARHFVSPLCQNFERLADYIPELGVTWRDAQGPLYLEFCA
jgi:hypothetical protein